MYALIYQDATLQWETTFDTLQEALEYAGIEMEAEKMELTFLKEKSATSSLCDADQNLWVESLYDRLSGGEKCIKIAWSSNRSV